MIVMKPEQLFPCLISIHAARSAGILYNSSFSRMMEGGVECGKLYTDENSTAVTHRPHPPPFIPGNRLYKMEHKY